jgi:hypothetical protein
MLQAPQLAASLMVSAQAPAQAVRPGAQLAVQAPAAQRCPDGHFVPQAPQFCESFMVSAQ